MLLFAIGNQTLELTISKLISLRIITKFGKQFQMHPKLMHEQRKPGSDLTLGPKGKILLATVQTSQADQVRVALLVL